jgi:hypothetical protein
MARSAAEKAAIRAANRDRREGWMRNAGITDNKVIRRFRDKKDTDVTQMIKEFIAGKALPPPNPSDLTKKQKEKYKPLDKKGEGYLVLGWRDKTETVDGSTIIETKKEFKDLSEASILTLVYGNRRTGAEGYIDQHGVGEFGVITTEISRTKEGAEQIARNMRGSGYTILYSGQGSRRQFLLPVIGALSLGMYSADEKRLAIFHFISEVIKVNNNQGKRLREDFNSYYGKGY